MPNTPPDEAISFDANSVGISSLRKRMSEVCHHGLAIETLVLEEFLKPLEVHQRHGFRSHVTMFAIYYDGNPLACVNQIATPFHKRVRLRRYVLSKCLDVEDTTLHQKRDMLVGIIGPVLEDSRVVHCYESVVFDRINFIIEIVVDCWATSQIV